MSLLAVHINDAGITVFGDRGIVYREPGFALLEDDGLVTGEEAYRNARLKPRRIQNTFWRDLSLEPLADARFKHLSSAELVSHQLESLWKAVSAHGDRLIVAIPPYMSGEQLGLFLGIAAELDIPIVAPAELRAKLTTGMKISWGVVTAAGEADRVSVEIAAIDGDELAELDEKLAEAPAVMRHYFRAAALLKAGFPTAAYRATLEEPDAAASLAMRARALNALDALDSRMGDRLREAVAELPEAKQDAWFR